MQVIKLAAYGLAGLIASNTLTTLAVEFEAIRWILVVVVAMWMWTLTGHGHAWAMKVLRLDDAELGTLRIFMFIVFVVGVLINQSFQGGLSG